MAISTLGLVNNWNDEKRLKQVLTKVTFSNQETHKTTKTILSDHNLLN